VLAGQHTSAVKVLHADPPRKMSSPFRLYFFEKKKEDKARGIKSRPQIMQKWQACTEPSPSFPARTGC
jgi:hypothetical protein